MFTIKRLNHAVMYVRNATSAAEFYQRVLGFSVVEQLGDRAYFLRANGSDNHHDLGLFGIGAEAPGPSQGRQVGMYHGDGSAGGPCGNALFQASKFPVTSGVAKCPLTA